MDLLLTPLAIAFSLVPASVDGAAEPGRRADPVAVLGAWDARRAEAWRSGSPDQLDPLYVAGSHTGRRDRAMLAAYAARGLHVPDLHLELLRVRVRDRSPGRLVLRVTDRLLPATAVGDGLRLPLPQDRPSTRVVCLRRVAGEWRVVEVRGP